MTYFKYQSKHIYYDEVGEGKSIVLLHDDTASSKMFEFLLPLYSKYFKVITIVFLGNGASVRVEKLPIDL